MHNLLKVFGISASMAMAIIIGNAHAADGRAAYVGDAATSRDGAATSRTATTASPRMPSMPTLPIISVGDIPSAPNDSAPIQPDKPGDNTPDVPDTPTPPAPECPDDGVQNSTYTIQNCMNDILQCINTGALPGGLNDMFNEDVRNAVVNGMGLCAAQVEKCVTTVRRDCKNVYDANADVWIDFNARKVQPEYYNFVLRKTGLTPNQAENTCMLLDKNTYGTSFNAIANNGLTTSEYNNQVGAYNSQHGNILIKSNPQGATVNDNNPGVDGQRGHYARWDATNAECLIRVAAYNKDEQITNNWLFGAIGNDQLAQVWQPAGETFTCNKDLFGFSLMNDTNTAAVVGIGGGTVVGASIGAIAGHGERTFDCNTRAQRVELSEQLHNPANVAILNDYLDKDVTIPTTFDVLTVEQCEQIVNLNAVYRQLSTAVESCDTTTGGYTIKISDITNITVTAKCEKMIVENAGAAQVIQCLVDENTIKEAILAQVKLELEQQLPEIISAVTGGKCTFKPINKAQAEGRDIYCDETPGCKTAADIRVELARLGRVLDNLPILNGEKSNMGKSIGIGAAVGAGTGGLATAITAYVEKSNVNCRVGDGLAQVALGKAYSIDTLKDFYVKWNLRLPDTVAPTAKVTDCADWQRTCATFTDLNQCKSVEINYQPDGAIAPTLIRAACMPSGSECIENTSVAKSYGACKYE